MKSLIKGYEGVYYDILIVANCQSTFFNIWNVTNVLFRLHLSLKEQ